MSDQKKIKNTNYCGTKYPGPSGERITEPAELEAPPLSYPMASTGLCTKKSFFCRHGNLKASPANLTSPSSSSMRRSWINIWDIKEKVKDSGYSRNWGGKKNTKFLEKFGNLALILEFLPNSMCICINDISN